MKSKPLSSIDETLIDAGTFLEEFRDEEKLDCLRTFVDCADIVGWIRTYTKGNLNCTFKVGRYESLILVPTYPFRGE